MSAIAIILSLGIGILNVLLIYLFSRTFHYLYPSDYQEKSESGYPQVSVVIAMRNEEGNIRNCLESIKKVNYPSDKLEVLVGDDDSEDLSYAIAEKIAADFPAIKVIRIDQNTAYKGKVNALIQLCQVAKGEFLAFTDADVEVPETWLKGMLVEMDSETALVTGVTAVKRSAFQNIDWVSAFGMVKTISDFNVPVTSTGNNMMVRRTAFDKVGGYEGIGTSVVEDFELFRKITSQSGLGFKQLFNTKVLAFTQPVSGVGNFLMQRKRWMKGAMELPWLIKWPLFLQGIYYPMIIALFFINPKMAVGVFWFKYFFHTLYHTVLFFKLKIRVPALALLFYEVYAAISISMQLVYWLIPSKIFWKGRSF